MNKQYRIQCLKERSRGLMYIYQFTKSKQILRQAELIELEIHRIRLGLIKIED